MKPSSESDIESGLGVAAARVLLCEDDGHLRRALTRGLTREGYAVTMATDGEDAVFQFTEADGDPCLAFDIVVMDYWLRRGGKTGGEAVNQIRALCPDQPVIFLSGDERIPLDIQEKEIFLLKPIYIDELTAKIKETIGKGGQRE